MFGTAVAIAPWSLPLLWLDSIDTSAQHFLGLRRLNIVQLQGMDRHSDKFPVQIQERY